MSTRRGETGRKRPQKYQNTRAFKNDLHDKTPKVKFINSLQISNVCARCKSILDWKIKYKKFKPIKFPTTCNKCNEKCVKHAYHTMCQPCASKLGVCPKCGKEEELVEPVPTAEERLKLDLEMQAMLKSLPERKRRTFLRFMEKSKKKNRKRSEGDVDGESDEARSLSKEEGEDDCDDTKKTTADLMAFLQRLKLSCKDGDDMDNFDDFEDSDDSFEDHEDDGSDGDDDGDDEQEEDDKDVKKK